MRPSTRHVGTCVSGAFGPRRPLILHRQSRLHSRPHPHPHPHCHHAFSTTRLSLRDAKNKPFAIRKNPIGKGKKPFQFQSKVSFAEALDTRLKALQDELHASPIGQQLDRDGAFRDTWRKFNTNIKKPAEFSLRGGRDNKATEHQHLRDAFYERGINGLDDRIKYAFYDHVTTARFTPSDIKNQKTLADLRYPTEWFPATRTLHRTIHLHVGPTNSGKTYHALKRLEQAESGVYAGPLRLLAHEVYTRLNAQGKRCTLITGEERRSPDTSYLSDLTSCTVEMVPLNKPVEVAVIDEIQMIGNTDRGWAWTQAMLGVMAKEVHLCGEARTVPLIRELCASVGEKLIVHEYKRLSPLAMADKSLKGSLKDLRKGDCIVSFSVMGIHALRNSIEKATGKKVATVYGSLPPETRAQQARLFNEPDNDYDFLVASDAIGMGLNLSIKRVIFESSAKFDGYRQRKLPVPDIKQIAGRAGRYKSAYQANKDSQATQALSEVKGEPEPGNEAITSANVAQNGVDEVNPETSSTVSGSEPTIPPSTSVATDQASTNKSKTSEDSTMGVVTTLEDFDFPVIAGAMKTEPEPLRTAGIFPPAPVLERFAAYFPPGTPFSYILVRLHELSQTHSRFHLCGMRDQLWIADLIEPVQGLTTTDRNILCACPASKSETELYKKLLPALARCIEQQSGGALYEVQEIPLEILEQEMVPNRQYLRELERLHKSVVTYLWLSYRFAGVFGTRPLAFHVKTLVEEKIEECLHNISFTEAQRKKLKAAREKSLLKNLQQDMENGEVEGGEGAQPSDSQTSITAGGDHFSGEADLDIMDQAEREADKDSTSMQESDTDLDTSEDLASAPVANFAAWRLIHTGSQSEENNKSDASQSNVGDKADDLSEVEPAASNKGEQ